MKICGKCKENKSVKEFVKSSASDDGLHSVCKPCQKAYNSEYRKKNGWDGRVVANKRCSSCDTTYPSDKFYNDKSRLDGLSNRCKGCVQAYRKKNREKLLERARGYNKKRAESEKVEVTGRVCAQCGEFKEKDSFWNSKHTKDGLYSSCIDCKKKLESTEHRQAVRKRNQKEWRSDPKNKRRAMDLWNEWDKKKRDSDPAYKLRRNVMHAISNKLQGKFFDKQERLCKRIFDYLPYTSEELKAHIESQWEDWMSWDNYGLYDKDRKTWQIDHIIPQSVLIYEDFSDDNFLKCWSLDNLQPLETVANIVKGARC